MRTLFSLLLCLALGYSTQAQDSFKTYLTSDLAIHSSLMAWKKLETSCLQGLHSGKLKLYKTDNSTYSTPEVKLQLVLPAYDPVAKDTLYFPIEVLYFRSRDAYLELFHPNVFLGDTQEIGRVKKEDALKHCEQPAASLLRGMMRYSDFLRENRELRETDLYTYALMSFDSLQKSLETAVRTDKSLQAHLENGLPMPDSVVEERVTEMKDVDNGQGGYKTVWQEIPNQQKYKGIRVSGHLNGRESHVDHWGLLINPEWKYAGFNPGKIVWFYLSDSEIQKKDKTSKCYLDGLFYFAQLYLLDPENPHPFFKNNRIPIQNTRYPERH
ncbi:MAG: hypothetical protein EP332_09410 [Bacteroidetes bacterium]|nr:MAG: hypothetical protein EP332_09410 [Bacteroidota bacterium]